MPTMRPDIENSMAGANMAPPKRWIFCSINMPFGCNMLCEQERLNNELIVEDWLLAALTVLIRSDLGFGGTVDGK